jgi:hypothetical protein
MDWITNQETAKLMPPPMLFLARSQIRQLEKKSDDEFFELLQVAFAYAAYATVKIGSILEKQIVINEIIVDQTSSNGSSNVLRDDGNGQDNSGTLSLTGV